MTTGYYFHEDCTRHDMGEWHPEAPSRLGAIQEYLKASGLLAELDQRLAQCVSRVDLLRAHPERYLAALDALHPEQGLNWADPDTALNVFTLQAAARASGAAVAAVDAVLAGELLNAFCAVRPPGHHAEHALAMGFCFYNNVAVAAHAALAGGLERVAVVDFDVHHGNGTVDIFKDEPRVMVCSSFQHPFYPGRMHDVRRANIIHTPLAAGTRGPEFRDRVEADWLPALDAHRPQMILVSAGFDAHARDPLGGLELHEADFRWVTELIVDVAARHAAGRIVSVLEGGYDLDALARSVDVHVQVLREADGN
ncbi:MAG: histone deacetylase family protein [Pseudomonadales bacterium]